MRASKCVIIDLNGFFCEFVSVTNKKNLYLCIIVKNKISIHVFNYYIQKEVRCLLLAFMHYCEKLN